MDKKSLSERDICTKFITPALAQSGWDVQKQIREEYSFTDGRIQDRGKLKKRGKKRRADYVLFYKSNIPVALIEAKDNNHSVGAGIDQGVTYAEALDIPFVYSSNGDAFLERDRTAIGGTIERELKLGEFPSPDELWSRYRNASSISDKNEQLVLQDYHSEPDGKEPRYYQRVAINRTVEAVARGQDRILLVMATGTGKTYTAFQIIWRLWKAGRAKRVLYLADRNILIDQAVTNDFRPFGDKVTKIRHRQVDKSFEMYFALYQGVSGSEEWQNIYKQFTPEFFDLIVIDECHRGSAAEDSAWREVLNYFKSAVHLGMTATPKETEYVSNIHYFGDPVYTYSLRQGIDDGFLAPYSVIRVDIDKDIQGWSPIPGQLDKYGHEIEDRDYAQSDYDRSLVIDERTQLVAKRISEFLKGTDRFGKSIVFCVDIDHAERMRQSLVNENGDLVAKDSRYVVRITGDAYDGKLLLDLFIDPEERFPVIATTSKLLTTGVDAQTCKVIAIDAGIQSMTEFKQIIGRGTRIREDYGKRSFTILDFRNVTRLFADPDFDGDPVQVYEPEDDESTVPPTMVDDEEENGEDENGSGVDGGGRRIKYYVNNVQVTIVRERVQYFGPDGKMITESIRDYTRRNVRTKYTSLQDFISFWDKADQKRVILEELKESGVLYDVLQEEVDKEIDPFDLICHVAFDQPPLTRRERAENVRKRNYFGKYGGLARKVLEALLDKYADQGIDQIEQTEILKVQPFTELGSAVRIIHAFGGRREYLQAVQELEAELYR